MSKERCFTAYDGENAMRYAVAGQLIPPGGTLTLETVTLRSDAGSLKADGEGGLVLAPGRYLLGFTADAEADGTVGAGLALNGTPVGFAQCLLAGEGMRRLCVQVLLPLSGSGAVTVFNNTAGQVRYSRAVLTAVYLGDERSES